MKSDAQPKPSAVRVRTQLRAGLTWSPMNQHWGKSVVLATSMPGMTSETEVVE